MVNCAIVERNIHCKTSLSFDAHLLSYVNKYSGIFIIDIRDRSMIYLNFHPCNQRLNGN